MNDKRLKADNTDITDPLNRLQHMAQSLNAKVRMYESGAVRITWDRYASVHIPPSGGFAAAVAEFEREGKRRAAAIKELTR